MQAASSPPDRSPTHVSSPRRLVLLRDDRLVELIGSGSQAAFEVLYKRHRRGLLSLCRRMLGPQDDAEDVVQQTFFSAHKHLIDGDGPIHAKAWLYAIARNYCLAIVRGRHRTDRGEPVEAPTGDLADDVAERLELGELLADLGRLPDQQRAALILFEVDDLSQGDIARILGCEAAKVKSLVFQARSTLRAHRRARETPLRA